MPSAARTTDSTSAHSPCGPGTCDAGSENVIINGLNAFRVIMDATNNTPDIVDRNILYGQIFLQPTKTAEFIVIDFNILPTGASFSA